MLTARAILRNRGIYIRVRASKMYTRQFLDSYFRSANHKYLRVYSRVHRFSHGMRANRENGQSSWQLIANCGKYYDSAVDELLSRPRSEQQCGGRWPAARCPVFASPNANVNKVALRNNKRRGTSDEFPKNVTGDIQLRNIIPSHRIFHLSRFRFRALVAR